MNIIELTQEVMDNRRKAVEYLRTSTKPQGHATLYDPDTGAYCALGQMGLAVGIDAAAYEEIHIDQAYRAIDAAAYEEIHIDQAYRTIDAALGLTEDESNAVWMRNDVQGESLSQIADYFTERWGL
jgi:hypothetical protein